MPRFPKYPPYLPSSLSLWNLRHYILLVYWVFFRPTLLKSYFYQADPKLYKQNTGTGFRATSTISGLRVIQIFWQIPAYRNPILMMPGATILYIGWIGLPLAVLLSQIQGSTIIWSGVAWSFIFGIVWSLATGGFVGSAIGIAGGIGTGVSGGVALGIAVCIASGVGIDTTWAMVLGLAFGLATSVASSIVVNVAWGTGTGIMGGIALGTLIGVTLGPIWGIVWGLVTALGAVRFPFYIIQVFLAIWPIERTGYHPIEWDELGVFPLPRSYRVLIQRLWQNLHAGLEILAQVASNPFQRPIVQRALHVYLHTHHNPLYELYRLFLDPDLDDILDAYAVAPLAYRFQTIHPLLRVESGSAWQTIPGTLLALLGDPREDDWQGVPTVRLLLIGELAGRLVDMHQTRDRIVWSTSLWRRTRSRTPLTLFIGMLYELLDEEYIRSDKFSLSSYRLIYSDLIRYPGGREIALTFELMAEFLTYSTIMDLGKGIKFANELINIVSSIRPIVLDTLKLLTAVSAEITVYQAATSRVTQQAALLRATGALDGIDDKVVRVVRPPEQGLLHRIVAQWRRLISEAGSILGRTTLPSLISNPYVLNNPVTGALFVGREDILRELEELWSRPGQVPSVVIYGHRRMGKSSILRNLGARFGTSTLVVDFNMQRVGQVNNTRELLYSLALAIYDHLPSPMQTKISEPDESKFLASSPTLAFDRYLKSFDRIRSDQRLIIAVDEFELIEERIIVGRLDTELLAFWRGLIQTYSWFVTAFAGLHTLEDMTSDYWHPLFGSVQRIPVSFLAPRAARQLITQPTLDFPLDYDATAVDTILTLTGGQPYLIQLIGHMLVTTFNRTTFETGIERIYRFTQEDVEAVIASPEFIHNGSAYFLGIWGQAEQGTPIGQTAVLSVLAAGDQALEEIVTSTGLPSDQVQAALATLIRHDVIIERNGSYGYTVDLMRRWVAGHSTSSPTNPKELKHTSEVPHD